MGMFRNPWAIIIVVLIVVLLFGANKLPGLARNMGKSMRIFKSEVEELRGDDSGEDEEEPRSRPAREDREPREREYDPRDEAEADREPVRSHKDDDPYRRD